MKNVKKISLPYVLGLSLFFFLTLMTLFHLFFINELIKKHVYLDAKEALSFIALRIISQEELLNLAETRDKYLFNLNWLIDEFQSHPMLIGVLVWQKNKVILNTFPYGQKPSQDVIARSVHGLLQNNVFYLSSTFLNARGTNLRLLVAIKSDLVSELWIVSLRQSITVFICSSLFIFIFVYYLQKYIANEKKLLLKLADQEKLVAAGKFSALLAHEVRNPLNTLSIGLQTLQETIPEQRKLLAILLQQISKLNELVEELLALQKGIQLEPQSIYWPDLADNVYQSVLPIAQSKQIDLTIERTEITFRADPKWLERALVNLIKNALESIDHSQGKVTLTLKKLKKLVVFTIEDNGKGITAQELTQIGRPFFSSKSLGVGLGVYIAQQVAKAHQGKLVFKSNFKRGTVVRLIIYDQDFTYRR